MWQILRIDRNYTSWVFRPISDEQWQIVLCAELNVTRRKWLDELHCSLFTAKPIITAVIVLEQSADFRHPPLPPCPFSRDIFNNRFHHFVFIASLWGWVDWQRLRTVKGDQQAWRADELLLLGNSSCWFYIMLIFKNLHEITGSCADTNKAPLSMDQKDQGSQGKNNNDNRNLVCNTECF